MTSNRQKVTTVAGSLYLLGILAGILSIAYAIGDPQYLVKASSNANSIMIAAFFHFLMAPIYLGVAISLYPILKNENLYLAIGFVSFRIMASIFMIIGVIILLLILTLSQEFVSIDAPFLTYYQTLGYLLQTARDLTNHVGTILSLSFGSLLLYTILLKSKLIPIWLSVWGLLATVLTIVSSYLIMFSLINVITQTYIILNIPMALQEITFAFWLIIKGFNK